MIGYPARRLIGFVCSRGHSFRLPAAANWLCLYNCPSGLQPPASPELALFCTHGSGRTAGGDSPPRAHYWAPAAGWLCFARQAEMGTLEQWNGGIVE